MRRPSRRAVARLGALSLLLSIASGCAPARAPATHARVELAELAGLLRPLVETAVIDIGEPSARERLESGWGPDESGPEGSFAWAGGERAVVRFELVEPRPLALALRGWSYPFATGEPQRLELALNGTAVEQRELPSTPTSFRVRLPAHALLPGENRLELRFARRNERPGEQPWAAAFDGVRFDDVDASGSPTLDASAAVVLPARTAFELALELPADAWLELDAIDCAGEAQFELGSRDEGSARSERLFGGCSGSGAVQLSSAPGRRELRLEARGAGGSVRLDGVRLRIAQSERDRLLAGTGLARERPADAVVASPLRDAAAETPPNLLVYVIDTLRADRLGVYGYGRPTSPSIDALARESVLWGEARAQSSWTKPAMGTLLTGTYPVSHGADRRSRGLATGIPTIGDRLRAAGYATAFFTTNPTVTDKFGFDRGFDDFRYLTRAWGRRRIHLESEGVHDEVVRWLDAREPSRPFLLVVHTLDPHDPYTPPESFRLRFAAEVDAATGCCVPTVPGALSPEAARAQAAAMSALYDAEIAQNDASVGRLLDELRARGLLDTTAFVLTSDHGEEFYDHGGFRHAETLYEEVTRIPLLLRLPRAAHGGRRIDAPADQSDLVPTLLDLAGLPPADELPGASWLPALAGGPAPDPDSFAWLEHPSFSLRSIVRGGTKAIFAHGSWRPPLERGVEELFLLGDDPLERANRRVERGLLRRQLRARLELEERRRRGAVPGAEVAIDAELDRSLRALGYL